MTEQDTTSNEAAGQLLSRRSALIGAGGLAGSLALATATPSWARKTKIAPVSRAAQRLRAVDQLPDPRREVGEALHPEIKNLVLVMMENHSTDNVLGMLGQYSKKHLHTFDGLPFNKKGRPIAHNPNKKGKRVYSYPLPDMCPFQGLSQDWNNSHYQWDKGRNDGFVITTDSIVPMSYLTPEQMPISYTIAANYSVSDRNFCSLMGQTLPNRRFYFSGTSSGYCNDTDGSVLVTPTNGTIFDRLDHGNVAWSLFTDGTPTPEYFLPTFATKQQLHCGDLAEFHELAAQGKLTTVTYVEANGNWESEENPQDIAYGENFLANVVNAVQASPQWPHIALFVTYDEHGGYFDHVPPAVAVEPDGIQPILNSTTGATYRAAFNRTGFRVPHTIVSPWAKPGYVSHKVTDHTSALAFIETQWNLPPMTKRDAAAWDYSDQFDFSAPSHERPVKMPKPPSIDGTLALCRKHGENPPTPKNDGGPSF